MIILILRIVAIALYVSSNSNANNADELVGLTAFTLVCLFSTLFLDLYHYCVWWHYTPYIDTTCCCCRSRQHTRYLPYILVGEYRNDKIWGDRSCPQNPCPKRRLEHITTFHSSTFQPQARWTELPKPEPPCDPNKKPKHQPTYIGFHTTKADSAVLIAKSGFLPSSKGMLGPGAYFARSLQATIGKVGLSGGHGAWIIAEIRMGDVYVTKRQSIDPNFVTNGAWRDQYDTCYCVHPDDNLDEFCIKDPKKQIVKWVIVIKEEHDPKVKKLGLDTEFDSTAYGCF